MTHPIDAYFTKVYRELRSLAESKLAADPQEQSLEPTGLVHEAYIRMQGFSELADTQHFMRSAAMTMEHILTDRGRKRRTLKRGAGIPDVSYELTATATSPESFDWSEVVELLEIFERHAPRQAQVFRLRVFGDLRLIEIAALLDLSKSTVSDDWAYATAWLRREWSKQP